MKLYDLMAGVMEDCPVENLSIEGITADTRQIKDGYIFFCLEGFSTDGHKFAQKAVENGAVAVVCQKDVGLENQIIVEDSHSALALCSANFFKNPQREMKLIGITGTNGKTSVTNIIFNILTDLGMKTGMIGTISARIGERSYPARYTTPDPVMFYGLLAQMRDAGCTHAVTEISSHGLEQKRVDGCHFEVGVFTNLTQDHLDYHGDIENYYQAKKKLFDMCDKAVISIDDEFSKRLSREVPSEVKTYSVSNDMADYTAKSVEFSSEGTRFAFVGNNMISRVKFAVPGAFSLSNAMASIGACIGLGIPLDDICKSIESYAGVPGRYEVLKTSANYTIIRDYAHTPDAIEKILLAVKAVAKGRVIILFGCAGARDRTKRHLMTQAAATLADFVVLTSDNPRHEDPVQIINDALPGFKGFKTQYNVIPDRYDAIKWAISFCVEGDTLILAGKGHEDYQVLDNRTIHFDETEIVAEILEKLQTEE